MRYDDMTRAAHTVVNIPARDPGIYDLTLGSRTSGTRYSDPSLFGFNGDFAVNFLDGTLIKSSTKADSKGRSII